MTFFRVSGVFQRFLSLIALIATGLDSLVSKLISNFSIKNVAFLYRGCPPLEACKGGILGRLGV